MPRVSKPRRMKPVHQKLGPVMKAIIRERIRQQCTLKQMAERTNWSYAAIWNYENNLKRVPLAYAEHAAQTLGLKVTVVPNG